MSDRPPIPNSRDDLRVGHHVIHYTFMPMLLLVALSIFVPPVLWLFGYISFEVTLGLPWASMAMVLIYISIFGDYVIPRTTYLKCRNGEWD